MSFLKSISFHIDCAVLEWHVLSFNLLGMSKNPKPCVENTWLKLDSKC